MKIYFDDFIFEKKGSEKLISAAFVESLDKTNNQYSYSVLYNTVYPEAGSIYMNLMN